MRWPVSVVVGSAITRPGSITATFVEAIRPLSETTAKAARYVIGIDIGGTAIKSAVVGEEGSVQLAQQGPDVALDRPYRNEEPLGDLGIGQVLGHGCQDLGLAC